MNINEYQQFPWKHDTRSPFLLRLITKRLPLLKPITLKPVVYISLFVVIVSLIFVEFLSINYLLSIKSNQYYYRYEDYEALFTDRVHYNSIHELLKGVKSHHEAREYKRLIYILRMADITTLVETELANPEPNFIDVRYQTHTIYGIDEDGEDGSINRLRKYKFVTFPGTPITSADHGYEFWILWAIDFSRKYNVKLESELKKAKTVSSWKAQDSPSAINPTPARNNAITSANE